MIKKNSIKESTEEALQKSLKEVSDYKYILEEFSIIAITDQKGIIKYVNNNFCKISKYQREELIGNDHRIINSGYHPKEFIKNLWITISKGEIWRGELKNKAKDGSYYWVDTSIIPFMDEENKPYQYVAIRVDITEQKIRAEELIIAEKELIFQNQEKEKRASELITANKELIFQNEEKEKRASELIIANKELLFQNMEKEKRAAELIIANEELLFQNKEKEKMAFELVVANKELAFQNQEKEKRASELIIANEELIFQNKEKEKQTAAMSIAIKGLEKTEQQLNLVNEELESFSYSISHDLRAPLRSVNGYAKILEEDYNSVFDDEGKRLLSVVQDNAKKMGVLIDELLAFSRLGRKEINKSLLNNTLLVKNVVSELNTAPDFKPKIIINDLHLAMADYAMMKQVWMNLLSNAIKYSSTIDKPIIIISSEEKAGEFVYSITDNGVGFDMKYAHKLFGVFQRLHAAEDFEGVGVGLALVQRIIIKQGGKIWAHAKVGKGATFNFSLPAINKTLKD